MLNEELRLEEPNMSHEYQHQEMLEEFLDAGEMIIPRAMRKQPKESYQQFLQRTQERKKGKNLPEQRVPSSLYFVINKDKKIIGAINVRHTLNEALERLGGHIGYGIRPSERNKGYATRAFKGALEKCNELGITNVIATCDKENIAASKVIQNNGGILESEYLCKENGNTPTQRRYIEIK